MKLTDQIKLLNSAFRRIDNERSLYRGFSVPKIGIWTRADGFKKLTSLQKDNYCLACPIVAMVENKIREDNLELTITSKIAQEKEEEDTTQIDETTITRKIYETTDTENTTILEIPRYTRKNAVFLLSGLGNKVYEITSVTSNILNPDEGGEVGFYALASEGSKVLYHLGMYKVQEYMKQVLNCIWSSPTTCPRCSGTGTYDHTVCAQCDGYGYDGYNADKGIQLKKAFDVGLTREKFTYPATASQNDVIKDFVNKVWTQKWWVTPTVKEIKRLFAHFYGIDVDAVFITERYHDTMPQWNISLPTEIPLKCPFTELDEDLMRYIAESVTPAGVNVFLTFYVLFYFGNMDDLEFEGVIKDLYFEDSIEKDYADYKGIRMEFYNGWNEACHNFETGTISPCFTGTGIGIAEPNDRFRHALRLSGINAYAERSLSTSSSGCSCDPITGENGVEFWIHPETSDLRISLLDCSDNIAFWIEYNQAMKGFRNSVGEFFEMMTDSEAHVKIYFDASVDKYDVYIDLDLYVNSEDFDTPRANIGKIKFENMSAGTGFIDCLGWENASDYEIGDNYQDLYIWGWGIGNEDSINGINNLYRDYFRKDRPILW